MAFVFIEAVGTLGKDSDIEAPRVHGIGLIRLICGRKIVGEWLVNELDMGYFRDIFMQTHVNEAGAGYQTSSPVRKLSAATCKHMDMDDQRCRQRLLIQL